MGEIPEHKIRVITEFNEDLIQQRIEGFSLDSKVNEIIRLKDEGVREALIKLGWTPPQQ